MSGASASDEYSPGLEGVIASETAIANIEGKEGAGGLEYRGYRIEDLAGHVSYEETAFLLLHGDLPNRAHSFSEFDARLRPQQGHSRAAGRAFSPDSATGVHPMDVLRSSVSVLAHFDPDVECAADRPRGQRPQGRADGRPDGDGGGVSRADRPRPARDPASRRSRSRRQLLEHGQRQGSLADDARRRSTSRWCFTPSTSSTPRHSRPG